MNMRRKGRYLFVFVYAIGLVQSLAQATSQANDPVLNGHPISFYITNKNIPQVCKDLYAGKRQPSDDSDIISLMDSIFTSNKETAPFYFLTLTRTMANADGAYAEPLGMMAKSFVETRTKEFVGHFINEPLLTTKNLYEWARLVAGEIEIASEGKEKEQLGKLKEKLKSNCTSCSAKEVQLLSSFVEQINHYLH
jgi:hypothetical protein